jgi:DNA (cytosine-5)-methyltransferase 1
MLSIITDSLKISRISFSTAKASNLSKCPSFPITLKINFVIYDFCLNNRRKVTLENEQSKRVANNKKAILRNLTATEIIPRQLTKNSNPCQLEPEKEKNNSQISTKYGIVMNFRLGELFSGAGGLASGAVAAKISKNGETSSIIPTWANDYNEDACKTYRHNISNDNVFCCDVANLNMATLPKVDALAFGFPCNDFSDVGEKKGVDGIFGQLYQYCVKALKQFQPMWFLAENVGGLRNANDGKAFKTILQEFAETGYNIVPNLYKFEQYGVPQSRHRIIIVGIRKDIGHIFKIPAPTSKTPITSRAALENPPIPDDATNQELTKQAKQVVERLQYIQAGENAFNATLPEHLKLKINGAKISQIYKRLDPNRPAYTVTGSGGGGTHMYHWKENRALTNRERARLQTFPDTFIFCGSKESVRRQIGMAVPPKGVQTVFEAVLKTFAEIDYNYVEPNLAPLSYTNSIQSTLLQTQQIRI